MRTMKIWKLAFAMLAAFSLASCSSDSEENREYQPAHRSAITCQDNMPQQGT